MTAKFINGIVVTAALLLGGCSPDAGPRESTGAVIGGVTGGVLGSVIGRGAGDSGRAATTIFGAALGAIVGGQSAATWMKKTGGSHTKPPT